MSWLYSQVLVEESLVDISLDGEQCALWSGTHTQRASWLPAKTTDACRLSRSGMTCRPLTDDLGEDVLTWCLEASLARTLVQQGEGQVSEGNAVPCGSTWRESFARFDQDTSSWRTPHSLLAEDSIAFLETWPKWGMMRNGECWVLEKSEQTTKETGFGLLVTTKNNKFPTPTCHNSKEGAYPAEYNRKSPLLATYAGGKLNPMWTEWLMGWPLGWTDLKLSETGKSPCAQQPHGIS